MDPFCGDALKIAGGLSTVIVSRAVAKENSLTPTGALAAWFVAFLSLGCGFRGFLILVFYQIGSLATKFKLNTKKRYDASALIGSARSAEQVLCCSIVAVVCGLAHAYYIGREKAIDFEVYPQASTYAAAILAHYATCLADTLSSELGMLSKESPRLITSGRRVPPGTNGGVTIVGFVVSAIGGGIIGLAFATMDFISGLMVDFYALTLFGVICGVLGSAIDSLLGATMQATYFDEETQLIVPFNVPGLKHISGKNILSNAQVNLFSVIITTAIGGMILGPIML